MLKEKQIKAIEKLTKAFKACKAAGLCFAVQDFDMFAYDTKDYETKCKESGAHLTRIFGDSERVKTHETIFDSGY